MLDTTGFSPVYFAPFVSSVMTVRPEWIDYNGHLNMAYYHVLFDAALGEAYELIGVGQGYMNARNLTMFTGEVHVVYKRELAEGDPVRVRLQLLGHDAKRLHILEELCHAGEGWVSATCELIALHVDLGIRKVAPFPGDIAASLAEMARSHGGLPQSDIVGRAIRPPSPAGQAA